MPAASDTPSEIRSGVHEFTIIARRQGCRGTGPNLPDDTSAQKVIGASQIPLGHACCPRFHAAAGDVSRETRQPHHRSILGSPSLKGYAPVDWSPSANAPVSLLRFSGWWGRTPALLAVTLQPRGLQHCGWRPEPVFLLNASSGNCRSEAPLIEHVSRATRTPAALQQMRLVSWNVFRGFRFPVALNLWSAS